jgi:hypothetical protein
MKHFINLTRCVINKLHIIEIVKTPSQYSIRLSNNSIRGVFLLSSGQITTYTDTVILCETKDKADYDTITEFINVDADPTRREVGGNRI